MAMSDKEIERIASNDKEWREFILKRIESIDEKQVSMLVTVTTLKVKFGLISSIFGILGGIVAHYITKK